MLLRPRTGLQDMTIEIDPGTSGEPLEEGATIPLAQTEPNVQPDQILASLDGDTRAYLQLLLQGGGEGLGGRGKELSAALRRFEPLARDLARDQRARSRSGAQNIASVDHHLQAGSARSSARNDTQLAEFVDSLERGARRVRRPGGGDPRDAAGAAAARCTETRAALASGEQFAERPRPGARRR